MYQVRYLLAVALALTPTFVPLRAQETRGAIFGHVSDAQSRPVPAAAVEVTNVGTNITTKTRTNETGYYEAGLLMPGQYQVNIQADGFRSFQRSGITLSLGLRLDVSAQLEVGATSSTVTVTADSPLLEADRVTAGRSVDTHTLESLPLFWGNTTDLMRFAPTVFSSGVIAATNGLHALSPGMGTTMAGGVGQNTFSLDGAPNIARSGPSDSTAYQPLEDAVQEVKIETFNFDAAVGHTTGIHMAVITKSGSNQLHGSFSDRMFQQRLNGTSFFVKQNYFKKIAAAEAAGNSTLADALRSTPRQPSGHANTYGAALGGPVVIPHVYNGKDKLFFFFDFDGVAFRSVETPSSINYTIPTAAQRTGDFSDLLLVNAAQYQVYDPLTVQADSARSGHYVRTAFPGNVIPASRIVNPAYSSYLKLLPATNNNPANSATEPLNNYYGYDVPQVYDYYALTHRVDYQLSNAHRFFVRWNWNDWLSHRVDWTHSTVPGFAESNQYRNNFGGAVNWVYSAGPRTVLNVTVSDNDHVEGNRATAAALAMKPSAVGLPSYIDNFAGSLAIAPTMALSGYQTLGPMGSGYPTLTHTRLSSGQATLSHMLGRQTIRAGFDVRHYYKNVTTGGNTSGNFTFNNSYTRRNDDTYTPTGTLGYSWAAFLLGLPSSMAIATPATMALHNPAYGWYLQDDIRVTPKLTFNLGLRFEWATGPAERYNRMIGAFAPAAALDIASAAQTAYASAPIAELASTAFNVSGGSLYPGAGSTSRNLWQASLMPMPRIGVAYSFNPKTVVRAGYGVYYDSLTAWTLSPAQTGFSATTTAVPSTDYGMTWTTSANAIADPFPTLSTGSRFVSPFGSALGVMTSVGTSFTSVNPAAEPSRQQRWTASVQRQLGSTTLLEVSYSGSYSSHVYSGGGYEDSLSMSQNLNPVPAKFWADGSTGVPATANASNLSTNVANPFSIKNLSALATSNPALYAYLASNSFFTASTTTKAQLLKPYPQMSGVTLSLPSLGAVRTHQLDINLQRRFSRGLSLNASYTKLYNRTATTFLNAFETLPTWQEGAMGRPHRFEITGVYELPFGKGRHFLASGPLAAIVGGLQLSSSYEWQPGPLVNFSTNLFYSGQLGGIAGQRIPSKWFNTSGFQTTQSLGPRDYQTRTFPLVAPSVRSDRLNIVNANLQREFRFLERYSLQLRLEALNLANRSQFGAPATNPYSTSFGAVSSTTATYNRFLQFFVRLRF